MKISGSDREYELVQWSNDWISTLPLAENSPFDKQGNWVLGVVSPSRVILNAKEIELLQADRDRALEAEAEGRVPATGSFWKQWALRTVISSGHPQIGFFVPYREAADAARADT